MYQPLSVERNEIRVLRLIPSTPDNEDTRIHCVSKVVSLNDVSKEYDEWSQSEPQEHKFHRSTQSRWSRERREGESPRKISRVPSITEYRFKWGDYSALSYYWGDASITKDIVVDGHILPVTSNLEAALQVLRVQGDFHGAYMLWIDAISINQHDISERNQQVRLMADIYQKCWNVLIWAGPEEEFNNEGIDVIELMASFWPNHEPVKKAIKENEKYLPLGGWFGMYSFMHQPYWRRLWIVQEVVMGHSGTPVMYGSRTTDFETLWKGLEVIRGFSDLYAPLLTRDRAALGYKDDGMAWNVVTCILDLSRLARDYERAPRSHSLIDLLDVARFADSKDPRDKVYGIRALFDEKFARLIKPNYNENVSTVYSSITDAYIRAYKSMDILRHAGLLSSTQRPTWAPDWTKWSRHEMSPKCPYSACPGDVATYSEPVIIGVELKCSALIFDAVDGLAKFFHPDMSKPMVQGKTRTHAYGSDEDAIEAFKRNMICDRNSDGGIPTRDELEKGEFGGCSDTLHRNWFIYARALAQWKLCDRTFGEFLSQAFNNMPESLDMPRGYIDRFGQFNYGRRLMTTQKGYFGWALRNYFDDPPTEQVMEQGDLICVVASCTMPLIIRRYEDGFHLVGECYVQGMMNGEAILNLEEKGLRFQEIRLY